MKTPSKNFTWSFHLKSTFSDFIFRFLEKLLKFLENFENFIFFENIFLHDEILFFVRIFFCDQVCISTFDLAAQNNYMEGLNRYMASKSKKVFNSLSFQSTIFIYGISIYICEILESAPKIPYIF